MAQFRGKVAVVVGAGSGIGSAIARLFCQEGASVALVDRLLDGLETTRMSCTGASSASVHVADVTDDNAIKAVFEAVVREHGGIDILVNSAGILDETPILEMTRETWDRTITVDLTGVFVTSKYVVPHMIARGGGRIINIASQLGIKGGKGLAHYVAAKAGVIGFDKALALELAPHNILVNSIAPGPIETPLIDELSDNWKSGKRAELPLGRFGTPEEVAPTALFLASSPGGDLYTGQTLGPNSGDVMP